MSSPTSTRRTILLVLKLAFGCAILAFLIVQAQKHEGFSRLVHQPKQWGFLFAALVCTFASISLSFVRWFYLVHALDLKFRLADAFRLGSLGFVLNFVSFGSVGGDLFKAFFLAREQPGRRTEAVATVMADRVLGLLSMLVMASGVILLTDFASKVPGPVKILCQATLISTALGLLVAGVLLLPVLAGSWLTWIKEMFHRLPVVGVTIGRLINAVAVYRERKLLLLYATAISFVVDVLFIGTFYLVARGLPINEPSLAEHVFIVPLSLLAGALPATPAGLGTQEAAVEALYLASPSAKQVLPGDGTIVALGQRLTMVTVALFGLVYYLTQRAEVREVMAEAEQVPEMGAT